MGKQDEERTAITVAIAVGIGLTLRWRLGWPATDPVLVLIAVHQPTLYRALYVVYTTLLFTTPYLVCSVVGSLAYIFVGRIGRPAPAGAGRWRRPRKMYAREPITEHTKYGVVNSSVV